jgi:hypothetical protein
MMMTLCAIVVLLVTIEKNDNEQCALLDVSPRAPPRSHHQKRPQQQKNKMMMSNVMCMLLIVSPQAFARPYHQRRTTCAIVVVFASTKKN